MPGFLPGKGCEGEPHVPQDLGVDAPEAESDEVAEARFPVRAEDDLGAGDQLLHQTPTGPGDPHQFGPDGLSLPETADTDPDAAHIALVQGTHHLHHPGEGDGHPRQLGGLVQLPLVGTAQACGLQHLACRLRGEGAALTCQHCSDAGTVVAREFRGGLRQPRAMNDPTQRPPHIHLVLEVALPGLLEQIQGCPGGDGRTQRRKDGDRTLVHGSAQSFVDLPVIRQTGVAHDEEEVIEAVRLLFLQDGKYLGDGRAGAAGQAVDGIAQARSGREHLRQSGLGACAQGGHVQALAIELVSQHDPGPPRIREDAHPPPVQSALGADQDTGHIDQFLPRLHTDDASLVEEGLHGCVAGGHGPGMTGSGTTPRLGRARFDPGESAALPAQAARDPEQFEGFGDGFQIEDLDGGVLLARLLVEQR